MLLGQRNTGKTKNHREREEFEVNKTSFENLRALCGSWSSLC